MWAMPNVVNMSALDSGSVETFTVLWRDAAMALIGAFFPVLECWWAGVACQFFFGGLYFLTGPGRHAVV